MEKKVCFVVPTYPAHYIYARDLMKSFHKFQYDQQADLYFVFTNEPERDGFLPCNAIVLPSKLRIMKNRGIINIKKFYALTQLKDQYEYIIVINSEAEFVSTVDLYKICMEFFENKILYGNITKGAPWDVRHEVVDHCAHYVDEQMTCPLYLWWNNLPIYKTDTLNKFFRCTGLGKRLPSLTWVDFDYYIYMFYLLKHLNFSVEDIGVITEFGASELTPECSFQIPGLEIRERYLYMATEYAINVLGLKHVFLKTHVDRCKSTVQKSKIRQLFDNFQIYREITKLIR